MRGMAGDFERSLELAEEKNVGRWILRCSGNTFLIIAHNCGFSP